METKTQTYNSIGQLYMTFASVRDEWERAIEWFIFYVNDLIRELGIDTQGKNVQVSVKEFKDVSVVLDAPVVPYDFLARFVYRLTGFFGEGRGVDIHIDYGQRITITWNIFETNIFHEALAEQPLHLNILPKIRN